MNKKKEFITLLKNYFANNISINKDTIYFDMNFKHYKAIIKKNKEIIYEIDISGKKLNKYYSLYDILPMDCS